MENLPSIETESVVIPATEEKVFDKLWVTNFTVNAEDPKGASLSAILRPFCSTTGEVLLTGKSETVNLQDLFGILGGTKIEPKLTPETVALGGQVMGGVLLFLKKVLEDKAVPDPEPVIEEPFADPLDNGENNDILEPEPTPEPEPIVEPEII